MDNSPYYFQVFVTKIDHKEENNQNILFNNKLDI